MSISMLSMVWFSSPFWTSTSSIAMSAAEPPLILRFENTSCPGVSMTRSPGILSCAPDLVQERAGDRDEGLHGEEAGPNLLSDASGLTGLDGVPLMLSKKLVLWIIRPFARKLW